MGPSVGPGTRERRNSDPLDTCHVSGPEPTAGLLASTGAHRPHLIGQSSEWARSGQLPSAQALWPPRPPRSGTVSPQIGPTLSFGKLGPGWWISDAVLASAAGLRWSNPDSQQLPLLINRQLITLPLALWACTGARCSGCSRCSQEVSRLLTSESVHWWR